MVGIILIRNYDLQENPMFLPEVFSNIGIGREDPTDPDIIKRNFLELFDEYLEEAYYPEDNHMEVREYRPIYLYYLEVKDGDAAVDIEDGINSIQENLKEKGIMQSEEYDWLCKWLPRLKWVKITYHPTEAAKVELEP